MTANVAELAESFARDGFVVAPNLYSRAEVKVFKEGIQHIVEDVRQEAAGEGSSKAMLDSTGVYVGLAGRSGLFRRAVRDSRLVDILEAIIGPNVEFLSDKVVFKDTERHTASPWHQDWPYWEGAHKISVWVALDDATPENGCLKFMPGSHLGSQVHDGASSDGSGFGHRVRADMVDEDAAVTVPLEAGSAVFFHDLTMHSSHPNTVRGERWTWVPTYRDALADDPEYAFAVAKVVVRGVGRERGRLEARAGACLSVASVGVGRQVVEAGAGDGDLVRVQPSVERLPGAADFSHAPGAFYDRAGVDLFPRP